MKRKIATTTRAAPVRDFVLKVHRLVARVLTYVYANELPETAHQAEQFVLNLQQHETIIEAVAARDRAALSQLLPDHAGFVHHRLVYLLDRRMAATSGLVLTSTDPG